MNRHTPLAHRRAGRRHPVSGRRYPRGNTRGNASDPNARPVGDLRRRVRHPRASHPTKRNDFTASGVTAADHHLECEQTRMGPRVVGDGFETLVYPVDDGAYYQTTFAYWRQLLAARARRSAWNRRRRRRRRRLRKASGRVSQLTVRRSQPPRIPLLDAWTATGTGGR